jgi:hypothetical protein
MLAWLTWDRAGPVGESGGLSIGKDRESDMESRHLQSCSPCLCRLKTNELPPASKYWTYWSHTGVMSHVNRYSLFINRCLVFIYYFNGCEGREIGWRPADRSADGLRCSREFLFLENSGIRPTLLGQCERLSHTACHERVCIMCIRFLLHDVHQFESSWFSDMSNCFCLSFYLRCSLGGYTVGTTAGFPVEIIEALAPTISPPNPAEVPPVPYEYLFRPPSSDRLRLPAQRRTRGLLSG